MAIRIPSGVTDQYVYFNAFDVDDYVTRLTGLASFTVYRSRNGGASAAMTTPTINETDTTNMPGVYELLLDEDMTIDSGDDSQHMIFYITATGMVPVALEIELYRPKITAGETLTVASSVIPWNAAWDAEVQSEVADELDTILSDSVPSDGTRPTSRQALYMMIQFLLERTVSGTTCTVKKVDGSTTLFTLTLDDATSPTSVTRSG